MARILEEETLPWHSPDVWTPQPHTYAFHAIHASHFVATQCHERFKHGVQDLGDRGKPDVGQPSISTDPSLSWAPGLSGRGAGERSWWQPSVPEPANRWQGGHHRAVMVNRTKAKDEPAGGTWEAEHSGRN